MPGVLYFQDYTGFTYFRKYHRILSSGYASGCNYERVLNMPGFFFFFCFCFCNLFKVDHYSL